MNLFWLSPFQTINLRVLVLILYR